MTTPFRSSRPFFRPDTAPVSGDLRIPTFKDRETAMEARRARERLNYILKYGLSGPGVNKQAVNEYDEALKQRGQQIAAVYEQSNPGAGS